MTKLNYYAVETFVIGVVGIIHSFVVSTPNDKFFHLVFLKREYIPR